MTRADAHTVELDDDERQLLALVSGDADTHLARPTQGIDNRVTIAGGRWVLRTAATAESKAGLGDELSVLQALSGHRVPAPIARLGNSIVYERLEGAELDLDKWRALGGDHRTTIARQLHATLRALHALPGDMLARQVDVLDAAWVRTSIQTCSSMPPRGPLAFEPAGLLDRFEAAWALGEPPMAIVNVDLKPPHLLLDGDRIGIIDFGGLSLADPALDYGVLVHYVGDDLLFAMGIADSPLAARARCYADLYPLRRYTRGWTRTAAHFA